MKTPLRSLLRRCAAAVLLCATTGILSAQTYLVSSNHLRLKFVDDTSTGLALESFEELPSGNLFPCSPPPGVSRALWNISPEGQATAGPDGNCTKVPWSFMNLNGFMFTWSSIAIAPAPEPTVRVDMIVAASPTDRTARWWISVRRNAGSAAPGVALLQVDCPILWLEPLVTPAPNEDYLSAQARSRLLLPTNFPSNPIKAYPNQNLGMLLHFAQSFGGDLQWPMVHPGEQNLQFSALYVSDPGSPKNRRILYFGSEDRSGHHKLFRHGVRTFPESKGTSARLHWKHSFTPSFWDVFANPTNPTPTRHGNTFASPYPVATGVLVAQSDDWWYDACENYRTTVVESPGLNGGPVGQAKLEVNPWLSDLAKAPALVTLNIYEAADMPKSMEVHQAAKTLLTSAFVQPTEYYHTHTCAPGTFMPHNPPVFYPGFQAMAANARLQGINTSIYLYGPNIADSLGWPIPPPPAQKRDISGLEPSPCILLPPGWICFTSFDPGRALGRTWLMDNVFAPIRTAATGVSSVYLDSYVGAGASLAYDHPLLSIQEHPGHGGDHSTQGRRSSLEYWRTKLRNGTENADASIMSEGIEEFLHDRLDFTQHGWSWIPHHLLLAEDATALNWFPHLRNHVANVPIAARNPTPPLWEAVYHAYSHAQNVPPMITATPLESNPHYGNQGLGLSPAEWVDIQCYTRASRVAVGGRAAVFSYFGGSYHDLPAFRLVNGTLVPGPYDPQNTGTTVYAFIKTMHEAEERSFGGQFAMYGDMLRPLSVNYQDAAVDRRPNPTKALIDQGIEQDFAKAVGIFPEQAEGGSPNSISQFLILGGYNAFDVPSVLHSVWRSPEGKLGIVLVNWTAQPASFKAPFDPSLYAVTSPGNFQIEELTHSGNVVRSFQALSGTVTLDASATPMGPVALGLLPAHSVTVLYVK